MIIISQVTMLQCLNNRHPLFALPRTNVCCAEMFKPYPVYRLLTFPSHSHRTLAFGRQEERLLEPQLVAVIANQMVVNVEAEEDELL